MCRTYCPYKIQRYYFPLVSKLAEKIFTSNLCLLQRHHILCEQNAGFFKPKNSIATIILSDSAFCQ